MQIDLKDFSQFATVRLNLSGSSLRHCLSRIECLFRWLDKNNLSLNEDTVERYIYSLKQKGLKNNSINTHIFAIRQLDKYAKARKWPNKGFSKNLTSLHKNKPKIQILTPQEISKLLKVACTYGSFRGKDCSRLDGMYRTMIAFIGLTGCRYSEAARLEIKNLDLSGQWVIFEETKNRDYRRVHVANDLIDPLTDEIGGRREGFVFRTMMGNQVPASTFGQELKKRARKAGITKRVHPHLLRHSFATQLIEENVDISKVATVLGHKDIQTTFSNYVHLADQSLKTAVVRHPLIKKSANPIEVIKDLVRMIQSYKLDEDERFNVNLTQGSMGLSLSVNVRGSPKRDAPPSDRKI